MTNIMKKLFLILPMLIFMMPAFAQNKKDLLQMISDLNQTIGELKGRVTIIEQQLKESNSKVANLEQQLQEAQKTIASLNESVGKMNFTISKPMTYKDSIIAVVTDYLDCDSWQEQLKYVMEPERVRPLMAKYYKNHTFESEIYNPLGGSNFLKIQGKNHIIYVLDDGDFYLVKTDDGYKIDWEATKRYGPTLDEIKRNPNKEFELRTRLLNERQHIRDNYDVYTVWEFDYVYCETRNNSTFAKKIRSLFGDEEVYLTIKVKYNHQETSPYGDVLHFLEITDIVSNSLSKY